MPRWFGPGSVPGVRTVDQLETRLLTLDPRVVDAVLALTLGVTIVTLVGLQEHPSVVELLAGVVLSATVAARRRAPVLAVVFAGIAASVLSRSGGENLAVSPVVLVLDCYSLGRRSARAAGLAVDVVLGVVSFAAIAVNPGTPGPGTPLVIAIVSVWGFFFGLPYAAGRAVASRTRMNAELRANAERLEQEQRDRARQVVIDERTRIARELHDVVAHSVSVMVIQTQAARRVADRNPATATEALRAVENCGRDALVDMRRMIGVLHRGDIDLLGGASPGLAQLGKLAERAQASGLPVQIRIEGEQRPLSAAVDLVSFRVVQEALTNAMKHAGPARARVRVIFSADGLELEITDTGEGAARSSSGRTEPIGHGLVGMQERLTLYGGHLQTGHRRGGGFQVVARIPLTEPALT
jgi:signal transduction histidine kinase